jgi:hypothetical protein
LDTINPIHVVAISEWENWEDLSRHRTSNLAEEKILKEFGPHIIPEDLNIRIYNEIG